MTNLNRIREVRVGDVWASSRGAAKAGWMVVQGTGAQRSAGRGAVTPTLVQQSGLRLVPTQTSSLYRRGEYEMMEAPSSGVTPRWLKAMWFASVLVSGWALYWVSLSA